MLTLSEADVERLLDVERLVDLVAAKLVYEEALRVGAGRRVAL